MRAIFISYRRDDSEGQAGRLFNDLVREFGESSVFMDVAGLEPGRDFRRAIDEHVASCGVLLAMIGKSWVDAKDESGQRRLDDASDFVRLETAAALKREIPVIPVLVHGARMPRADQLPPDLAELAYRNGIELTHARWDSDVQVLVKALARHVELRHKNAGLTNAESPGGTPSRPATTSAASPSAVSETVGDSPSPSTSSRGMSVRTMGAGVAAALIAVAIGGYAWSQISSPGSETTGQVGLSEKAERPTAATPSDATKPAPSNVPTGAIAVKPDTPRTTPRPAPAAFELCKELEGQAIDFVANNYPGVIGASGIKLERVAVDAFRFEAEVVFSGRDIIQQFGKPLRDRMVGMCDNNNVITLDRKLENGTLLHHHTGTLTKGKTGTIEMTGSFKEAEKTYAWSGSIVSPSRK